ncbi:MAG TPA: DUF5017 domain-containing protein [Flavobacterium sp.]|nr:DUF5017 domain-containing protein [Flavobacterium sp.]
MKHIKYLSMAVLSVFLVLVGCSPENNQELPQHHPVIYFEDFQGIIDDTFDETIFQNYIEVGSKNWFANSYQKNGYYEFSPFNSGENLNIAWFITPGINLDAANAKRLTFESAQHHVVNTKNNHLKVLISTNFTGNVGTANWTEVPFKTPEIGAENNYDFFSSGIVDLKAFNATIHIAFKATGGTGNNVSGAYMIDNIKVF